MSFKRSVERSHKTQLTHQQEKQKNEYQSNFNFTWIPFRYQSFIVIAVIFVFSQFLCTPLLTPYCGQATALVIAHGIISSVLLVLSFWVMEKDKVSIKALLMRYCFCALMFGGFSLAIAMLLKL